MSKIDTDEGAVNSLSSDVATLPFALEAIAKSNADGVDAVTARALLATSTPNGTGGDPGVTLVTSPPLDYLARPPVGWWL